MTEQILRLIHNNRYAVVEQIKDSYRPGYAGDARTYVTELKNVLHLLNHD